MSRLSAVTLSLAFCLAFTAGLAPQEPNQAAASSPGIPQLVRFSGVLRSPGGQPLTGTVVVRLAIYQEQSGGEPLWEETQQLNLDEQGRYTVLLGATEPTGLPLTLFQSSAAHWLGVTAGQAQEQPRTLLVSVPYALKAADAETIGGKPLSAFVLAGTATGTGSDGLNYINPSALAAATANPAPNATSGTAGYIGKFVNATDLGNSAIFQLGSNIGIGTTSPTSTLTLGAAGKATATSNYQSGAFTTNYAFWNGTAAATNSWAMAAYPNGGSNAGSHFQISPGATDPGPQSLWFYARKGGSFRFNSDTSGLQLAQSRAATTSANYAAPSLKMLGNYWTGTASLSDWWSLQNVLGTGTSPASTLAFQHGGSSGSLAVTLPTNAKLGLGVASPASTLDVAGTGHFTGAVNFGSPVTFAGGQTFPGTSTITSVNAGTALTGGGSTGNVTLNLDTAKIPQLAAPNVFTGNQAVTGNLSATGQVTGSAFNIGGNLFASGSYTNANAFLGFSGNTTMTGGNNTATGYQAFMSNITGVDNTAIGVGALQKNTGGSNNTAIGGDALSSDTVGSVNSALGEDALQSNTTGNFNTAIGAWALFSSSAGTYNSAQGYQALYNSTGSYNTASGGYSLFSNTAGIQNTAAGYNALYYNVTGNNNTALGYNAGPDLNSPGLSNSTAIGANAFVSESNALVLGGTGTNRVNVGIGTATPASTLDVHGAGSFTGQVTANSLAGNGAQLTSLNPASLTSGTAAISISGNAATATNASALGGKAPSAFQPAGSYATLGPNTFAGSQTMNGNLTITGTGNGIKFPDGTSQTSAGNGIATALHATFGSTVTSSSQSFTMSDNIDVMEGWDAQWSSNGVRTMAYLVYIYNSPFTSAPICMATLANEYNTVPMLYAPIVSQGIQQPQGNAVGGSQIFLLSHPDSSVLNTITVDISSDPRCSVQGGAYNCPLVVNVNLLCFQ